MTKEQEIDPAKLFATTKERVARMTEREIKVWTLAHLGKKEDRAIYERDTKELTKSQLVEKSAWILTRAWIAAMRVEMPPTNPASSSRLPLPEPSTYKLTDSERSLHNEGDEETEEEKKS